ncbi:MAG: VOC family protein [Polyangiales bacterium]
MALRGINHLAFITPDLEGTIRFYRDLLDMELSSGIGHDGYRHYFFRCGNAQVAFFEYEGAAKMNRKFHGVKSTLPLGFDHVSFTVDSVEKLFDYKDRLEAAGIEVVGAIDHGTIWSIYFFDPNEIPLEISWDCLELIEEPAIDEDDPMPVAAEGMKRQPGVWPEPKQHTPRERFTARPGNGHHMRDTFLREGKARMTEELRKLLER